MVRGFFHYKEVRVKKINHTFETNTPKTKLAINTGQSL